MKRGRGRPPSDDPRSERRTIRFTKSEDREIAAALALEHAEFNDFARPLVLAGARKAIEKARKR